KGLKQGRREGRQTGLQKGRKEGLLTGRQEGLYAGLLTGAREAVLEVLEARFGAVPPEIEEMISAQTDLPTLRRWQRQAATLATLDAFQDTLGDETPSAQR
ncbi:MAG: hypothetical protein KIT22_06640, partial [Verrucomicrobiae bacterium]|nr:hypothetical protein [Verrucomicrobiae bacterium]